MAAGESSSRPPATLTAPSVARTQNTPGFLQSPFQAGLELHSGGLLTLLRDCVFTLVFAAPPEGSILDHVTALNEGKCPPQKNEE